MLFICYDDVLSHVPFLLHLVSQPLWLQAEKLTDSLQYTCDPVTVRFNVVLFMLICFLQWFVKFLFKQMC